MTHIISHWSHHADANYCRTYVVPASQPALSTGFCCETPDCKGVRSAWIHGAGMEVAIGSLASPICWGRPCRSRYLCEAFSDRIAVVGRVSIPRGPAWLLVGIPFLVRSCLWRGLGYPRVCHWDLASVISVSQASTCARLDWWFMCVVSMSALVESRLVYAKKPRPIF